MPEEIVLPPVLTELEVRVRSENTSVADLAQVLRALQHLGFPQLDLEVHLERIRAVNGATAQDPAIERNALLAIDLVIGQAGDLSLSWDAREMARVYVPRVVDSGLLRENQAYALTPSDLLPRRPAEVALTSAIERAIDQLEESRRIYDYAPHPAEFFRVPKDAFTSRPAAVLAMEDRFVLEALVGAIEPNVVLRLPEEVVWPRRRAEAPDLSAFRRRPASWKSTYIVKADIERFFESVNHALLAVLLGSQVGATSHLMHAIESFLGAVMRRSQGLPQGPLGSDILSSAYLLLVDNRLLADEWQFVRYADDYYIAAESMADGRRKLEQLESYLGELGLHLNGIKTRIMRRETYEASLTSAPRAITQLKARLRQEREVRLLEAEDAEEVQEILQDVVDEDDQILWDVLYHGTMTMVEAIEELGTRLDPSTEVVYRQYLYEIDRQLASDQLPEDMAAVEQVALESVAYMAVWKDASVAPLIERILPWFPSLGPSVATYLQSTSERDQQVVDATQVRLLTSLQLPDWTTAFLCESAGRGVEPSSQLLELLNGIVMSSGVGLLTRASAAWALADHNALGSAVFFKLYEDATEPIRGDLRFAAMGAPIGYPWLVDGSGRELPPNSGTSQEQ